MIMNRLWYKATAQSLSHCNGMQAAWMEGCHEGWSGLGRTRHGTLAEIHGASVPSLIWHLLICDNI